MNIAILGGGNGSYTTAADLALAGHRVRLWRRSAGDLAPLQAGDAITLVGEGRGGAARLDLATADLAEALDGAEVVIAPLPATSHADLAGRLVGRLTGKEIVLLTPGTLGSYAIARDLARAGGRCRSRFAESGTLPYLTRKTGPAAVSAPVRAANLPVGVFPASRSKVALARISRAVPVHPAVRRRARRRADQRGPGHPSAARAGERGPDRRRDASTSTPPAPRPAPGASSTRSTPSGSPPGRAGATRRPTTSSPPTTTRRARRKGSTASAPSRSWWRAASGARC